MGTTTAKSTPATRPWILNPLAISYAAILACALIYTFIVYQAAMLSTSPPVSAAMFFVIHLAVLLPEVLVWVLAARGAISLKTYTRRVIHSPDGRALDYIANALLLIVIYSIMLSMGTAVKSLFIHTAYFKEVAIITNHLPVALVLASSIFLYIGSHKLDQIVSKGLSDLHRPEFLLSIAFFSVAIVTFAECFYRLAPNVRDDDGSRHFVLAPKMMLFTYVLPQAITWLLGLLACLNLSHYAYRVKGAIYKRLFQDLYRGLMIVFACTFIAQALYILNISTDRFSFKLLGIFGLLIFLIIGYLLVYRGTRRLERMDR